MNCPKCGKTIIANIPKELWLRIKSESFLKQKLPKDVDLMYLVNSGYKDNLWLCHDCFKIWSEFFHSRDNTQTRFKFDEAWEIFSESFREEVVIFT